MKTTIVLASVMVLLVTSLGFAGSNPNVKVGVHVMPRRMDTGCRRNFPVISSECDIEFTYKGCHHIDFFPVFYDLVECRGVEYAVEWPGGQSCSFSMCGYTHIGEIVWSGDWIAQVWEDCQTDFALIPGWGWITVDEPGQVCVVPVVHRGRIDVLDCGSPGSLDQPVSSYCAGVCGAHGDDPCMLVEQPTLPTTWGSVKGMFR